LNFVAVPSMAVVQVGGLTAVVLQHLSEHVAGVAAHVAHLAVVALLQSARLVDVLPWLSWRVPPPSTSVVILYYACLAWWLANAERGRRIAGTLVAVSVFVILAAPTLGYAAPPRGWLRATVMDVGQGDAVLIQFPGGRSLLVDAGPKTGGWDAGDRIVLRTAWGLGVRQLDWLVLTHPDGDHIGGASAVVSGLSPREVWEGVPVKGDALMGRLRADVLQRGGVWRQVQHGDRLAIDDAEVYVLAPPAPEWERRRSRNEDSIVMRVRLGDVEILLTGDAGHETERRLASRTDDPRAPLRILKVAHHGSRTSSSPAFVGAYAPAVAIASAGRGNVFGHPSPEVSARFMAAGTHLWRTDRHGAVVIETDGAELRVAPMIGPAWHARVQRGPA
jgi:competence protein ComEC